MPRRHVITVAHPEQQRARRPVLVFVQLAARMHHERARSDRDRAFRRAHGPTALEAEINLGRMRMAVIGADLSRLPACDSDVTTPHLAEDLLHVLFWIELLLLRQLEHPHASVSTIAHDARR